MAWYGEAYAKAWTPSQKFAAGENRLDRRVPVMGGYGTCLLPSMLSLDTLLLNTRY